MINFDYAYFSIGRLQSTWTVVESQLERCDIIDRTQYLRQQPRFNRQFAIRSHVSTCRPQRIFNCYWIVVFFFVLLRHTSIALQIGKFEGHTSSLTIANTPNLTKLSIRGGKRLDSIANFHRLTTLLELEVCYSQCSLNSIV
jgi:hypothetical protein